jgi:hypothetical protein
MRQRKITTIARRWWRTYEKWNFYDFNRVSGIIRNDTTLLPSVIRALVATAPAGLVSFVGTSVIEAIFYDAESAQRPNRMLEFVLRARLSPEETVAVLSGVHPDMLESAGLREQMSGHLSEHQITELLNPRRPFPELPESPAKR